VALVVAMAVGETGKLVRDAAHLSIGQGFRLVIQAAYFVLLARSLGRDAFGAFVTVVALAALLGPLSGAGAANLFIKNVRSGKRPAAICWGNGILLIGLSGTLLFILELGISLVLHLKAPMLVLMLIGASDLLWLKVSELAASGFTALDRMGQTAIQSIVISLLRLTGIAFLMVTVHPVTLDCWAVVYLLTSLLGAAYGVVKGSQMWGRPRMDISALREDMAEGIYFSIAGSAATVYNDIDKIMLNRLSDLAATGVYAAAYRVIDVTMSPVRSLAAATYPRFFREGANGLSATYAYARTLIARTGVYGFLSAAGLWLCAPALPHVLGSSYAAVVPAVRWLALIPFFRCIHSFLADALSGAGLQPVRTGIQLSAALLNIGANTFVLPRYSWRGAAWTSLGCDALLVVGFWFAVLYGDRGRARTSSPKYSLTVAI
jgi:O-antigen/teichoic acid export membrane protein